MRINFILILLLFSLVPLFYNDIEVLVQDSDLGQPLEGAVIRLSDGSLYTCDENGRVTISAPDGRQVIIQASYPGYENDRRLVSAESNSCTLNLKISGVIESRELVIEAARPGVSETKTGRSVAISDREISQSAEMGIIEDVVSSIKLLPGVGYAGFFDAMPSIRGGDPADMSASLDGFYIFNPYYWGGGFSIFDPRMVKSAQLSHGVYTSRYGHTISGLLDITSRKPSPTETEFEMGLSTSAVHMNLSVPLAGKGGVLFMGRVSYYDPFIAVAKQLAKSIEILEVVNSIRVAPYIRSGTITGSYSFLDNLELRATGFFGMDGIGYTFENGPVKEDGLTSSSAEIFDWVNYQAYFTSGLSFNPRNDMLLKLTAGTGYEDAIADAKINYKFAKNFSDTFKAKYAGLPYDLSQPYNMETGDYWIEDVSYFNVQGRIDYDWEPGKGFLLAAGVQEMFTKFAYKPDQKMRMDKKFDDFDDDMQNKLIDDAALVMGLSSSDPSLLGLLEDSYINLEMSFNESSGNGMLITSGYSLIEYTTPDKRFGAELGLRVDHYFLTDNDFSLRSDPALNPRLNLDLNVLKNRGVFRSLDISAGSGLFSSIDNLMYMLKEENGLDSIKPARSWTSVLGLNMELPEGLSFNIEGYYKYIFNRMYVPITFVPDEDINMQPKFNGEGRVWGIDLMVQKKQSRFLDGWISYSFNWAKYRDPDSKNSDMGLFGEIQADDWYFPYYHRFHNLNLVLNIKPVPRINIYTRFGIASGIPIEKLSSSGPQSYPVWVYDPDNGSILIEKYYWASERDENRRTTPSFPLDIKLSIFGYGKGGRANYELYVAVENLLVLLYNVKGNDSFNPYTGRVQTGAEAASYDIPIPIPSIGVKISY